MARAPLPGHQVFWDEKRASVQAKYKELKRQYTEADQEYIRLFKIICDIEDMTSYTPAAVGKTVEWTAIVSAADKDRANYRNALTGKVLFSALLGTYTYTLNDLKSLAEANTSDRATTKAGNAKPVQEEGFKEVRRRKRQSTTDTAPTSQKAAGDAESTPLMRLPTATTLHLSGQRLWTPTLPVSKPLHRRRQYQVKRAGRLR
jgi:hypothetical protein